MKATCYYFWTRILRRFLGALETIQNLSTVAVILKTLRQVPRYHDYRVLTSLWYLEH